MITEQHAWKRETFASSIPDNALDLLNDVLAASNGELTEAELIRYLHEAVRHLRIREIPREDGKQYLTRYDIHGWMPADGEAKKYPLSIYLHRFHAPDFDPAPHNHPWEWSRSLILTGGYVERRRDPADGAMRRVGRRPGDLNRIDSDTFHVVEELCGRETWTLFSAGPKTGTWGFWPPERGYTEWRDRLRERGLTPEY